MSEWTPTSLLVKGYSISNFFPLKKGGEIKYFHIFRENSFLLSSFAKHTLSSAFPLEKGEIQRGFWTQFILQYQILECRRI